MRAKKNQAEVFCDDFVGCQARSKGVCLTQMTEDECEDSRKSTQKTTPIGAVIWLCGLAGSGKSTLATALSELLRAKFDNVIYLDGDEIRELLGNFSYDKKGRVQVALWYSRLAKFLSKQGQIVIVSTISLFNEVYEFNRKNLQNYFEIFVECDFDELKRRDKKELYTKALQGKIQNVVGVDIEFDTPKPHFTINNTALNGLESKAKRIFEAFMKFYKRA